MLDQDRIARRERVEQMIIILNAIGANGLRGDMLLFYYLTVAKEFEDEDDREWLRRKFDKYWDIMRRTTLYESILQKGRERSFKAGMLEAQRETLLDIIQERFPAIVRLAKKQVDAIEDPTILRHIAVKMSIMQTVEEAEQYLLTVIGDEKKNPFKHSVD